jgi:hypothetical protein
MCSIYWTASTNQEETESLEAMPKHVATYKLNTSCRKLKYSHKHPRILLYPLYLLYKFAQLPYAIRVIIHMQKREIPCDDAKLGKHWTWAFLLANRLPIRSKKNMDRLALGIVCLDGLFKLKFALKCLKKRVRAIEHASDSTGLTFRPQLAPCSPSWWVSTQVSSQWLSQVSKYPAV